MRLVLTEAPEIEPVTLELAKTHCRVSIDADDTLITALIISARRFVENFIRSALITQSWTVFYDAKDLPFCHRFINLPLKPLMEISSVKTYDPYNTESVFAEASYFLSGNRIALNTGYEWPTNLRTFDLAAIEFISGYGDVADAVPSDIKHAILMLVSHWYENREASYDPMFVTTTQTQTLPLGFAALLQPYRTFAL